MIQGRNSFITKDFVFSKVSQIDVFEKYLKISINNLLNGQLFCNPLRTDKNPTCSFKVYPNKIYPEGYIIWFRDYADTEGYDCIGLVQRIANNCSFFDALCLISHHFSLLSDEDDQIFKYVIDPDKIKEIYQKASAITSIQIKRILFERKHLQYWNQYHLDKEDLEDDVVAIKCYWLNGIRYNPAQDLGFAYTFGNEKFKIYNPLANKHKSEIKFLHNSIDILQGENKLKFDRDLLIITSSYKDVKILRKIDNLYDLNYETIASMSETTIPPKEKIDFYKTKYKSILLYYNNDRAGIEAMDTQSKELGIEYIVNPTNMPKDISDISKEFGFDKAVETINNLLYE